MPNLGSQRWLQTVEKLLGGKAALEADFEGGAHVLPVPNVHRYQFGVDILPSLVEGAIAFTPEVDDILLDAWFDVDEVWNGTTPTADIAQDEFLTACGSANGGLFNILGAGGVRLDQAPSNDGVLVQGVDSNKPLVPLSTANIHTGNPATYARGVPVRFTVASPVKIYVTTDGTPAGVTPASTAGLASLYVVTVSPADPRMH